MIEGFLTLWYTASSNAVHYYSASLANLNDGLLVPLLPDGAGGQISGLLSATSTHGDGLVHTLLSVNQKGYMTMLQQVTDSGMWESVPFYTPSATNNIEIPSFTIRIQATSDGSSKDENTSQGQLHLVSSSTIQALANGFSHTLSPDGVWIPCDTQGILTLIVATADLACASIEINQFKSSTRLIEQLPSFVIDPTEKIFTKLWSISSGKDLINAKTQAGEPLIPEGSVTQADADQAAAMLSKLANSQSTALSSWGSRVLKQTRRVDFSEGTKSQEPFHLAGVLPRNPEARTRMLTFGGSSSSWDFFHSLFEEANNIVNWSLQTLGEASNVKVILSL